MPLPMPHQGEMQEEFIGRCMRDPATRDITGASADEAHQRQMAACFRQWRDGRKGADENETDVDTKAFGALEIKDEAKGEVRAVVATLNVVDKDGDVLLPGSFPAKARVKISEYSHNTVLDGAAPVGMGSVTVEGDKAVFAGHYFMSTQRGREAFATVKELGSEGEWSFGFPRQVKTAELTDEWKGKGARRLIAGLKPVEVSPVFVGAGVGTGTLSAKEGELDEKAAPTASVDGVEHPAAHFAYRPDPEKPSTWKLPIFDADHVRNALARWNQTEMPDAAEKARAKERLLAAARQFGVDAASLDASQKAMQAEIDAEYQRFERTRRQLDY